MTDKKNPRVGVNDAGAKNTNINDDCTRVPEGGQAYTVINYQRAVNRAAGRKELTPTQARVLCVMSVEWASWSDGSGVRCSQTAIASMTGYGRQTISRTISQLEELGWVRQTGWSRGCKMIDLVPPHVVASCNIVAESDNVPHDDNVPTGDTNRTLEQNPNQEEKEQQHAHTREGDIQDIRPAVTAPTPDDSKPVHNPYLDDDEDPRPPVVMICEEVEVYVGEQPSHVLAEMMYAELRRRVAAKLRLQGKSLSPAKVVREWVRHKLLMSSDWAERESASANRLVRVPAMGTDLEEWMDTRAGYDATTRKSRVPTKSMNQVLAEQEKRFFLNDDEEVA